MKLSVCVDALFFGQDTVKSMETVKSAGVSAFEFWTFGGKNADAIAEAMDRLQMTCAAVSTPEYDLADSETHAAFREALRETLAGAQKLRCKTVIATVGRALPGVPREAQTDAIVKGLRSCLPLLEEAGATLVVEPLNAKVDHPGVFLSLSSEAFGILDRVGSSHVKLLFDIYHQQVSEGNVTESILGNLKRIGHLHAAGVPGRHEVTAGELDCRFVLGSAAAAGYEGFVGLEYMPAYDTAAGIGDALSMLGPFIR